MTRDEVASVTATLPVADPPKATDAGEATTVLLVCSAGATTFETLETVADETVTAAGCTMLGDVTIRVAVAGLAKMRPPRRHPPASEMLGKTKPWTVTKMTNAEIEVRITLPYRVYQLQRSLIRISPSP